MLRSNLYWLPSADVVVVAWREVAEKEQVCGGKQIIIIMRRGDRTLILRCI
jgi:hypothetical protein